MTFVTQPVSQPRKSTSFIDFLCDTYGYLSKESEELAEEKKWHHYFGNKVQIMACDPYEIDA